MFSGCLITDCLRSYCLVKIGGFAHLVAPGPVSMMLLCMIVKLVELVDRIEMRKTDCLERQDLSCTYLAHHELEGVVIIISIIITAMSTG